MKDFLVRIESDYHHHHRIIEPVNLSTINSMRKHVKHTKWFRVKLSRTHYLNKRFIQCRCLLFSLLNSSQTCHFPVRWSFLPNIFYIDYKLLLVIVRCFLVLHTTKKSPLNQKFQGHAHKLKRFTTNKLLELLKLCNWIWLCNK